MTRFRRYLRKLTLRDVVVLIGLWVTGVIAALLAFFLISGPAFSMPLSAGDRVSISVTDGGEFSGKFQINLHGQVEIPYLGPVSVAGLEPGKVSTVVAEALIKGGYVKRHYARVAVQVLEWAPIEVNVQGAVYYPGRIWLNQPPGRDRAPDTQEALPGAKLPERNLSDAIRVAGGLRLDADVKGVRVRRGNIESTFHLSGYFDGTNVVDDVLYPGDIVIVPTTGVLDPSLARATKVTPPGVRIFASNLTTPAENNNAATVEHGSLSFAYGSRLSQAVIAANCTGGTGGTNRDRSAMLVRTDRISGKTTTWNSKVETILVKPTVENNPILLEGDGIACFDSTVTSVRDVFRTIADILLPFKLLR